MRWKVKIEFGDDVKTGFKFIFAFYVVAFFTILSVGGYLIYTFNTEFKKSTGDYTEITKLLEME